MSLTNPETLELAELLAMLDGDAIGAIGHCRERFRTSLKAHHQTVYDTVAFLAAFVLRLERSDEDRRLFLADPYWADKPHPPKEKNLVRLAALYVVGARESRGALYQQALQYAKVVDHFLVDGVAPADIPGQLRRTPIYRLLDELNGDDVGFETPGPVWQIGSVERSDHGLDEDGGCASDDDDDRGAIDQDEVVGPDPAAGAGSKRPRGRARAPIFDAMKHIAVTGLRFQHAILNLEPQENRWIRIRRVANEGEVLRFDVLEMECGQKV